MPGPAIPGSSIATRVELAIYAVRFPHVHMKPGFSTTVSIVLANSVLVVLEDNNGHLKQLAALCPPRPRASHEPLLEGPLHVSCRGAGPGGAAWADARSG